MALARWQATIQDEAGNVMPNASVTVRHESSGALPQLYSDRDGETTKGNPATADENGYVFFHVAGGVYKITATKGTLSMDPWRYVGIGTAAESDTAITGVQLPTFADAGDLTVAADERGWRIARDTAETADINLPAASTRAGLPLTIADGDGTFEAHPQTVKAATGDTIRGGTSVVLDSNWQVITFYPQDDDSWIVG